MIYTDMTKKAMRIAFDAHKEQTDKAGLPYIFHPFYLAVQMKDEVSVCAALLHDVAEDTSVTFEALLQQGISDEVVDALRLLTHTEGVPYLEYIQRIRDSGNRCAIAVKLADLRHNADTARLGSVDSAALDRLEKYRQSIRNLEG